MNFYKKPVFFKIVFVLSIALITFISVLSFRQIKMFNKANDMVEHTYKVKATINQVGKSINKLEVDRRNYLIYKTKETLSVLDDDVKLIHSNVRLLKNLVSDNKQQSLNVKQLHGFILAKIQTLDGIENKHINFNQKNLQKEFSQSNEKMSQISDKIDEMLDIENKLLQHRTSKDYTLSINTYIINALTLFITLAFLIFSVYRVLKNLQDELFYNEQLRLSVEKSNLAEQIGNYGTWDLNIDKNEYSFSENEYRLLGHKPYAFENNFDGFMQHVHAEDKDYVNQIVTEMVDKQNVEPFQFRIIRKDGKLRHFRGAGKIVKNLKGEKILLGITSDVTDEVERKQELQTAYDKLKYYNDSSKQAEIVGQYGFWRWNIEDNTFEFSDNIFTMFGINKEEFDPLVDNFIPTVYPDDLDYVLENLSYFRDKKKDIASYEHRIVKQNTGEIRHIRVSNKPMIENGNLYYLMITQDITNEVHDKKELKEKNRSLEISNKELLLTNSFQDMSEKIANYGNWHYNIKDDSFTFSHNLFNIFDLEYDASPEAIQKFVACCHPDDIELVQEKLKNIYNKKEFESFSHRIITPKGNLKHIFINNKLLRDDKGNEFIIVTTKDITYDVERTLSLEQNNRELQASNKELQAFNYVASHDLQEPLRKIETFISRLEAKDYDNLSDNGQRYLDRIKVAAGRMRLLIKDLLQFSRTNKSEQVFEQTNLNELLESAKQEIAVNIEEKDAVIHADEFPTLKVVPFQIQQLFINLLSNAIKYAKPDVIPIIDIQHKKDSFSQLGNVTFPAKKTFHQITVSDNGIGFAPEYAEHIFELFKRLHNKDEIAGTGIGLAICKKIVENHKGFIFAESEKGKGARFTFYLPNDM